MALSPRHPSGRPRRLDSPEKLEALPAQLSAEPDLTLVERSIPKVIMNCE
jgi:hypothetical protein